MPLLRVRRGRPPALAGLPCHSSASACLAAALHLPARRPVASRPLPSRSPPGPAAAPSRCPLTVGPGTRSSPRRGQGLRLPHKRMARSRAAAPHASTASRPPPTSHQRPRNAAIRLRHGCIVRRRPTCGRNPSAPRPLACLEHMPLQQQLLLRTFSPSPPLLQLRLLWTVRVVRVPARVHYVTVRRAVGGPRGLALCDQVRGHGREPDARRVGAQPRPQQHPSVGCAAAAPSAHAALRQACMQPSLPRSRGQVVPSCTFHGARG